MTSHTRACSVVLLVFLGGCSEFLGGCDAFYSSARWTSPGAYAAVPDDVPTSPADPGIPSPALKGNVTQLLWLAPTSEPGQVSLVMWTWPDQLIIEADGDTNSTAIRQPAREFLDHISRASADMKERWIDQAEASRRVVDGGLFRSDGSVVERVEFTATISGPVTLGQAIEGQGLTFEPRRDVPGRQSLTGGPWIVGLSLPARTMNLPSDTAFSVDASDFAVVSWRERPHSTEDAMRLTQRALDAAGLALQLPTHDQFQRVQC